MKFVILLTLLFSFKSFAGPGTKGDDPIKARFIMARDQAIRILSSPQASDFFPRKQLDLMRAKLWSAESVVDLEDCDEVYDSRLCWYNTNPKKPKPPLRAELHGKPIEPTLSTTPDVNSVIKIDVRRVKKLGITQRDAVIALCHEAGQVGGVDLSDELVTDSRINQLLLKYPHFLEVDKNANSSTKFFVSVAYIYSPVSQTIYTGHGWGITEAEARQQAKSDCGYNECVVAGTSNRCIGIGLNDYDVAHPFVAIEPGAQKAAAMATTKCVNEKGKAGCWGWFALCGDNKDMDSFVPDGTAFYYRN